MNGLTLIQALQVGTFVHLWFRGMDIRPGLRDAQFDGSVLGPRLKRWADLPGEVSVHDKWLADPRTMTFNWFDTLRIYLRPFQQLLEAADYKVDLGYVNVPNTLLRTR